MKLYTLEEIKETFKAIDLEQAIDTFIQFADPIELPDYKEQLDRIEKLLLQEETAKRNRFKIGPL